MHALSKPSASSSVRAAATRLLQSLETKLTGDGFGVTADGQEWCLVVRTEVPDPDEPGETIEREQTLQLGTDDQRQLRWYLTWPTDGPGDVRLYATLCPAADLDGAVASMRRLLLPADAPAEQSGESNAPTVPPTVEDVRPLLSELAATLSARGFTVTVDEDGWDLTATNQAEPDAADADPRLAAAYDPARLSQRVGLAWDGDVLGWHWVWPGTRGEGSPYLEYICPGTAIAEATERVARVLAMGGLPRPQRGRGQ